MAIVKNTFPTASLYNQIPFIHAQEHAAAVYADDLDHLRSLLDKHNIPANICIKLIHIHYHLAEGDILAFREISAPPHGPIPFLAPMTPSSTTKVYGCHYLVDDAGDLQAFEYTTVEGGADLAAYPAFIAEFCAAIVQRGLQQVFGIAIKSGAGEHGSWTELDFPEKRATFLLPGGIMLPQSDHLERRSTTTQFLGKITGRGHVTHEHTEHTHTSDRDGEPIGVSTSGGLFLTGIPLDAGSDFYTVVSAIAVA